MPINATPEYQRAEIKYHEAKTTSEKLKALEEMLKLSPSHKGAENLRSGIKQKISKLKDSAEKQRSQGSRRQTGITKEGAAMVVILGYPNTGKSTLLSKLTRAKVEIAEYPYTTKKPEQGTLDCGGIKIQVVEIPPIYDNFFYSEQGPTLCGSIRMADLIIYMVDKEEEIEKITQEMKKANIIIDKKKPKVKITRAGSGGLDVVGKVKGDSNLVGAKRVIRMKGYHNALIEIQQQVTMEELEEILTEGVAYIKKIIVTKKDDPEKLKEKIWKHIGLIKVFTKQPGKKPQFPPIALPKGSTVKDLANRIHKDFLKKFKFARVWGKSAKFEGCQIGPSHKLKDDDIVELHIK